MTQDPAPTDPLPDAPVSGTDPGSEPDDTTVDPDEERAEAEANEPTGADDVGA